MSTKNDDEKVEQLDLTPNPTIDLEQEKKLASSADDALAFAVETGQVAWTPEEERALLWKIDLRLLPLMLVASLLAYTDAQAYGMAAIFGLIQDLKLYVASISNGQIVLDLTKYQWSNSIANCGSMFAQYPILILAQFLPLGKFTSGVMMYSGLLALLAITCSDFADIMALRFFYGFQVVLSPLFIITTTMWWKTSEQPLRIGIWASGSSFGSIVGQGVDFGAIKIGGAYADHRWKWIYVIIGSITMGFAAAMVLFMPDSPMKALFLTEREKAIAVQRLQGNNTGIQTRRFKWRQFVDAFLDPQLYALCVTAFSFAFANAALGSFGGLLVTSFGYSNEDALKLSMPASGIAIFSMLFSGALSFKFHRHRCLIACLFILPTIAGNALLWKSPRDNKSALLAGLYISTTFYGAYIQQLSLLSSNVAGHSKKTTINAAVFVAANAGAWAGPFAYHGSESSRGYPTGQITVLSLMVASVACFAGLRVYYDWFNRRRDLAVERGQVGEGEGEGLQAFYDLTERENGAFRYTW